MVKRSAKAQPKENTLKTNAHIHLFTADHTPEIQFFYMLWNVFEANFVRRGVLPIGGWSFPRFSVTSVAKASWCFRLLLWVGKWTCIGEMFNGSLSGLVRIVKAMTHVPEVEIRARLGMKQKVSGRAFLKLLLDRIKEARKWDEPYPLDLVLAEIARDLYQLHQELRETPPSGFQPITQSALLENFFDGKDGGKARYQRVVPLTVNFDYAFQGLDKYGLAVDPAVPFEQQADEVVQLTKNQQLLQGLLGPNEPVELRPFLCVDPRHEPTEGLELWVKSRVNLEHGPFYGLKFYPPMGFLPTDPRLTSILEWCKEGSIPITSHCSIGGGGLRGLEERGDFAHPRHWRYVIGRLGKTGVLRLNLAHFSDLTRSLPTQAAQTWSDEIIKLMQDCRAKRPDVEIYSDISYAWVEKDWNKFEKNVKRIQEAGLAKWILFGSDWWNYLPDCTDEKAYLDNLRLADDAKSIFDTKLLEETAEWFLGLKGLGPRP